MAAIRGKNTRPELLVRSYLHKQGLRFRLTSATSLPCRPDLVFPSIRAAVFVHGCFWHQHSGCSHATSPRVNRKYWEPKLLRNRARDVLCASQLAALGWQVFVVWECEVTTDKLATLAAALRKLWMDSSATSNDRRERAT
jgi:DNA mismatch endonuclease, patch repair protein